MKPSGNRTKEELRIFSIGFGREMTMLLFALILFTFVSFSNLFPVQHLITRGF